MTNKIQAIRGMNDVLPERVIAWQSVEAVLRKVANQYGYQEIRLPILERTELFKRSIGDITDIVEKEMYTFSDRNGDSLTLRPEGTAGCVRAGIEHGLFYNKIQRLWYLGSMFRHERPQKGRYRQFHQFGVEAFGLVDADIDAELIIMTARIWSELGLRHHLNLQINSIGSLETRAEYKKQLVNYFQKHKTQLDEDSLRRLQTNPLRILDSKNPSMQELIKQAPCLLDFLDETSEQHFVNLQKLLKDADICFSINPTLVRGLDYYNQTVFEWVIVQAENAQNTVCAGGRYDGLVKHLGGQQTPAVGFAIGLERLIELLPHDFKKSSQNTIYFITIGDNARFESLKLAEKLRTEFPEQSVILDHVNKLSSAVLKRADKSAAQIALILGEAELESECIIIKFLRERTEQQTILRSDLFKKLARLFII